MNPTLNLTSLLLGLTWQDDVTQQVISRELSKLRNIPLRQSAPPSPLTSYSSRDRKQRPVHAELSRNLQQYLSDLGFQPQLEVAENPGVQQIGASVQVRFPQTVNCRMRCWLQVLPINKNKNLQWWRIIFLKEYHVRSTLYLYSDYASCSTTFI